MTDIPLPDKIDKWYSFFEKLGIVQAVKSFYTKPTIQDQFQEILNDINNNQSSLIIADKLGSAIQQKFNELQNQMPQADYYLFCTEVIKSIEKHLETAIGVWKNKIVNFSEVDEIWIACEPILDLVQAPDGTFDLLVKQINQVSKIKYYLSDTKYFDDLISLLKGKNIDTTKLECKKMNEKYVHPIVIYYNSITPHGMTGKNHPKTKKTENGFYVLTEPLSIDWMQEVNKNLLQNHINFLKRY